MQSAEHSAPVSERPRTDNGSEQTRTAFERWDLPTLDYDFGEMVGFACGLTFSGTSTDDTNCESRSPIVTQGHDCAVASKTTVYSGRSHFMSDPVPCGVLRLPPECAR